MPLYAIDRLAVERSGYPVSEKGEGSYPVSGLPKLLFVGRRSFSGRNRFGVRIWLSLMTRGSADFAAQPWALTEEHLRRTGFLWKRGVAVLPSFPDDKDSDFVGHFTLENPSPYPLPFQKTGYPLRSTASLSIAYKGINKVD